MIIYVASKTRHAAMWRYLRGRGVNINSTWIDEAGEGESKSLRDLAERCVAEVKAADRLVLFIAKGDALKGQLIETGVALAVGIPVFAIGFDQRSAFRSHPLWHECGATAAGFREAFGALNVDSDELSVVVSRGSVD